jgi:hypothetical protein
MAEADAAAAHARREPLRGSHRLRSEAEWGRHAPVATAHLEEMAA